MMFVKTAVAIVIFALVVDWSAATRRVHKSDLAKIIKKVFNNSSKDRISGEEALELLRDAQSMPAVTKREKKYMPIINELVGLCTEGDSRICSNWSVIREFRLRYKIRSPKGASECIKLCERIQISYCSKDFEDRMRAEIAKLPLEDLNQVIELRDFMSDYGNFRADSQTAKGLGKFIMMKRFFVDLSGNINEFIAEIGAHVTPVCDKIRGVLQNHIEEFEYKKSYFKIPSAATWFELLKDCSTMMENEDIIRLAHLYALHPLKE